MFISVTLFSGAIITLLLLALIRRKLSMKLHKFFSWSKIFSGSLIRRLGYVIQREE